MSNKAITAVWSVKVTPPAKKLVLLFMADHLNEQTGQLNPSIKVVADACGISSDQARRHLHDLMQDGLLEVVGNQWGGAPGSTRNYRLNIPATTGTNATPCADATPGTDAADGLHPCGRGLAPMQLTAGTHASQTRKNQKEPEENQKYKRAERADIQRPDSVPVQVWSDFLAIRKAKRAPLTATALDVISGEAAKAGKSLADVLTLCCANGWPSFDAERNQGNKPAGKPTKQPARENFNDIDYGKGIRPL